MLERENVQEELQIFADEVLMLYRQNLNSASGKSQFALVDKINVFENSFTLEFSDRPDGYIDFIDRGVRGAGGVRKSGKKKGQPWKLKKVDPNTPYSYTNLKPPAGAFDRWNIIRGRSMRDARGKFLSRRSLNFATATSVFHTGIEAQYVFTDAFEEAFSDLPPKLVEAYGLDIEQFIDTTFRDRVK